jgi:hypothetical protein
VDVARGDRLDAGDTLLQPGEKRRGAELRQRVAAFEAGEMLGLGRQRGALGGVCNARPLHDRRQCGDLGGNPRF